jgi:hypothetical protein
MGELAITWDRFTVRTTHDAALERPHLWVFGLRVDLDAIVRGRYVETRPASHPNLGREAFAPGEAVAVPLALDVHVDGIRPVLGRAVAGVVVVAWEGASTTDEVVQKAYDDAVEQIGGLVATSFAHAADDVLHERPPTPPSGYDLSGFADAIEARVRRTVEEGWAVLQPIADRFVGCDHVVVDLAGRHAERLDLRFGAGGSAYRLEGALGYLP